MFAPGGDARRWLADRDARSLNFLEIDSRHLADVRSVKQVAHHYVGDRPRWEYELHVHLFELTYRRFFRTWTADVWMVDHMVNVWLGDSETPLQLMNTEGVFTSGKQAMDRFAERRHISSRLFRRGVSYTTEEP
jgi:hypothetical protein